MLLERLLQARAGFDLGLDRPSADARTAGLLCPLPTMSKACSSGTPDFIIVASWRVKSVMSLSVILPPPRELLLLDLDDPDALAAQRRVDLRLAARAHLAAHGLAGLVRAGPGEVEFLDVRLSCRCRCSRCHGHALPIMP